MYNTRESTTQPTQSLATEESTGTLSPDSSKNGHSSIAHTAFNGTLEAPAVTLEPSTALKVQSERLVLEGIGKTAPRPQIEFTKKERGEAILTIVQKYRTHPRIGLEVEHHKKKSLGAKRPLGNLNTDRPYFPEDDLLPTDLEVEKLFAQIDKGVAVFKEQPNMDNLTPEQERMLIDVASAHEVLCTSYQAKVAQAAKVYQRTGLIPFQDLKQYGNIGLAKAVIQYDRTLGFSFGAYAYVEIRASILEAMGKTGYLLHIPKAKLRAAIAMGRQTVSLSEKLGREPTLEEIAIECGITTKDVQTIQAVQKARAPTSLDKPLSAEAESGRLGDLIADPGAEAEIEAKEDEIAISGIWKEIQAKLTPEELLFTCLYYGIQVSKLDNIKIKGPSGFITYDEAIQKRDGNIDGLTLLQLGEIFGLSWAQIKELHTAIVKKLSPGIIDPVPKAQRAKVKPVPEAQRADEVEPAPEGHMSVNAFAKVLGVGSQTFTALINEHNIELGRHRFGMNTGRSLSPESQQQLREIVEAQRTEVEPAPEGYRSLRAFARVLDVGSQTLTALINEHNIELGEHRFGKAGNIGRSLSPTAQEQLRQIVRSQKVRQAPSIGKLLMSQHGI